MSPYFSLLTPFQTPTWKQSGVKREREYKIYKKKQKNEECTAPVLNQNNNFIFP